jgi:transposase
LVALGHDVRLIPPQYAKPYVKRNKTDAADAEAICEAAGRPTMRFVPIKTKESQALLALHRVRSLLVRQRTAAVNSARGLLGEFGLVAPKGIQPSASSGAAWRRRARASSLTKRAQLSRPCSITSTH